jgi:propanediol dehydratase large subunit
VSLARAIGVQGVQNGGIDGASVAASVPKGVRELMAENVMVMARNLEACTGNDALMSESDVRRTSRTLPILLAGSDYVCSGFGSIQRYDNMFGPSQWNAEDIDDWLAMQRDWGVDGGLRTADPGEVGRLRREAAEACRDVYRWLGLADFTDEHVELAVDAVGSKDLGDPDPMVVLAAGQAIRSSGLGSLEVARALQECGYEVAAERVLDMLEARVHGDHLQTGGDLRRVDARPQPVTDPNDYAGPGTGYEPDAARRRRSTPSGRRRASRTCEPTRRSGPATASRPPVRQHPGSDPREVVIGLSPGVGRSVWRTLSACGHRGAARAAGGLEEEGCRAGWCGSTAPWTSGWWTEPPLGCPAPAFGIGMQGKGTALIHRRDLPPLANLELYSMAPVITPDAVPAPRQQRRPARQGSHARPARNPYTDEAIEARYHTSVIALVALERACVDRAVGNEDLEVVL